MYSGFICYTILGTIFLTINGYWSVVLVKRTYLYRKYKRAVERKLRYDPSDYISEQFNYHYQTEICKYVLFFVMNFVEGSIVVLSYAHTLLEHHPFTNASIYREAIVSCTGVNNSIIIDFQLLECSIPLLVILRSVRDVGELYLVVLINCLMSYLMGRMKKSGHINTRRYVSIIFIISVGIVLSSYHTLLIPLSKSIYLLVATYNYILFLIYVKRFKQALLQAARERLIQHGSNDREMKQYRYFSYTINCICIGGCFLIIATYLGIIARIMISFIFFGKCVFPTSFIPQLIDLDTLNNEEVTKIFAIFNDMNNLSIVIVYPGSFIFFFPVVSITIGIWIRSAYKMIRGKYSVQFRYKNASGFEGESTNSIQ